MKSIIIKKENLPQIEEAIRIAEGRASVRQISAETILNVADGITKRLDIPKKSMIGIKVYADPNAQQFPRAYKYNPESTHFEMEYKSSGWNLVYVSRNTTKAPSKAYCIVFTEEAKKALVERNMNLGIYDI